MISERYLSIPAIRQAVKGCETEVAVRAVPVWGW
jgi:hypothetical protein